MKSKFFKYEITDWESWSKVFCSIDEFASLIEEILRQERFVSSKIENCKPGTNGVFKVGEVIVKIFVPKQSGYDSYPDYKTELFALRRANNLDITAPKLLASGEIRDKYLFRYLLMEHIDGPTLGDIKESLSKKEKEVLGGKLKEIVSSWATTCEDFNRINVLNRTLSSSRWQGASKELLDYQKKIINELRNEELIYVHGDLTEDNIIVDDKKQIVILDFADSVRAPAVYEDMTIICDAFSFDGAFLKGYYGKFDDDYIVNRCITSLLSHEYGYLVIKNIFGDVKKVEDLKCNIRKKLIN